MSNGVPTTEIDIKNPDAFEFFVQFYTSRCSKCGEEPTIFGGHYHSTFGRILRGLCKKCDKFEQGSRPFNTKCPGCYGTWKHKYGLRIELNGTPKESVIIEEINVV